MLNAEQLFLELDKAETDEPWSPRGEVWLVDFGLAAKIRPCLVLSVPLEQDDLPLLTVLAHTTSPRGSRFEVEIKTTFLRPGVFEAQNLVTVPRAKIITLSLTP